MITEDAMKGFATGRNILLVEDNEINAQIAEAQLTPAGYNVVWVDDGKKGYDAFMESAPHYFSGVVTDLMMPVMDGQEAARLIRGSEREDSGLPILGITANAFSEEINEFDSAGIDKCLVKPYKRQDLLDWLYTNICKYEGIDVSGNEEN